MARAEKQKLESLCSYPPGAEPHDWEPTAQNIIKIKFSKLFLYSGAGLEPVDKLLSKDVIGTTKDLEVSKGIQLLKTDDEDEDEQHQDHKVDKKGHRHVRDVDAHVWLDPVNAQQEVYNILEALISSDPNNEEYYKNNAERYNQELAKLDQEYKTTLANTVRRDIITSHAAFGYLPSAITYNR